jgi:hypothetical protein
LPNPSKRKVLQFLWLKQLNSVPSPKLFGRTKGLIDLLDFQDLGRHKMRREQAVALVKELVGNNLIQTDWLSIDKKKPDSYVLEFRGYCERLLLDTFLQSRNLGMEENEEKGFCVIFKP